MKIGSIIFALFTLTSVGPLLGAVTLHRGDLPSLILSSSTSESIKCFRESTPDITYLGYEVVDPSHSIRAFFKISNPYMIGIVIKCLCLSCYCHEHGNYLGSISCENLPLEIPAKCTGTLSLVLYLTEDGKNDVQSHYSSGDELYIDLKDIKIVIQGIEVNYPSDITTIGPIPLTKGA